MGKASSSKKVARAAKVANRPGAKRSFAWPLAIGGVVLVGVLLVVLSFGQASTVDSPKVGEHWHAAYGVYHCDKFLPELSDVAGDPNGIHTHTDGLMHMHPFNSTAAGKKANIAEFASTTGFNVTDTSFAVGGVSVKNGDKCGDKAGRVELHTWDSGADETATIVTKDIEDYSPRKDGSVWVLAFVPAGTKVPMPDSVPGLANPVDVAPTGSTPATTAPGASVTTAPAPTPSSSTTAKP